jgi:hypothetical protein
MVRERFSLLIPNYWPANANATTGRHWSKKHKEKKRAAELIYAYAIADGGYPTFVGPVSLHLRRIYRGRGRPMDQDNLHGSVKALVDAMRKPKRSGKGWQGGLGIFDDDDPTKLALHVDQRRYSDLPEGWLKQYGLDPEQAARWPKSTVIIAEGDTQENTP